MRVSFSFHFVVFFACCSVCFGVALASWLPGMWIILAGIVSTSVMAVFVRSFSAQDRMNVMVVFVFCLAIAFGRYAMVGPGPHSIAHDVDTSVILEGRVVGVDLDDDGVTYVMDSLTVDGEHRDDRLRLEAPISSTATIGTYLQTACVLEGPEPFDGFAYDRFLAAKSMYAICRVRDAPFVVADIPHRASDRFWRGIGFVHAWISEKARLFLPEPQATLFLGLLIGENNFSRSWNTAFQRTGTTHIVAASGYNVAVVAELAMMALVTLGLYRRQAYPLVVCAIGGFVVLAGAGAAVLRAAIMGVLTITARHLGRSASFHNVIALTVTVMLLVEPRLLRDDVGFQLSVLATIGLIFLTDRIAPFLHRVPASFGLRESLASTIAATIATFPVTVFSFGQVSVVAPFVNLLVLPFIPYAMGFGVLALFGAILFPSLDVWIALPAWTALVTMTNVIDIASRLSFSSIPVSPTFAVLMTILGVFVVVVMLRTLKKTFERRLDAWSVRQALCVAGLFVSLFVLHIGVITHRSGRLSTDSVHVFVFDVGQGDGIYIHAKDADIVLDGGPTRYGMLEKLSGVRFPWERHIDTVFVTHPHADHVLGFIELLRTNNVAHVVTNGMTYLQPAEEAFEQVLRQRGVSYDVGSREVQPFFLGDDASLQVLWPLRATDDLDANNVHRRSLVIQLIVGGYSMLFTGDAEKDVETDLGAFGHVDILKVGHHGSDTSTSDVFLQNITPDIAVISVGAGNSYGHPSPFTLARLRSAGADVFRTDLQGTLRVDFSDNLFVQTLRFR